MARVKAFDEKDVLDKALQIFWCKGYNGTSMQDLIDGLGISRSSLYDTYGDKRALFLGAIHKYRKEQSKALVAVIDNSENIFDTIREMFDYTIKTILADKQQKGCFMVNTTIENAAHDKEIADIVSANQKEIEDAFYKAIKKGQEAGQIRKIHSAKALSRFVFNTSSGLRVSARNGADQKALNDIVAVTLSVL